LNYRLVIIEHAGFEDELVLDAGLAVMGHKPGGGKVAKPQGEFCGLWEAAEPTQFNRLIDRQPGLRCL
jgi:hypothetical protein